LFVDGRESFGSFGRKLQYQWSFVSDPKDELFDNLSTTDWETAPSYYFIGRSSIKKTTKVTITMNIRNWMGELGSKVRVIEVTTEARYKVNILGSETVKMHVGVEDTFSANIDAGAC
jgi:hypothetical protein